VVQERDLPPKRKLIRSKLKFPLSSSTPYSTLHRIFMSCEHTMISFLPKTITDKGSSRLVKEEEKRQTLVKIASDILSRNAEDEELKKFFSTVRSGRNLKTISQ